MLSSSLSSTSPCRHCCFFARSLTRKPSLACICKIISSLSAGLSMLSASSARAPDGGGCGASRGAREAFSLPHVQSWSLAYWCSIEEDDGGRGWTTRRKYRQYRRGDNEKKHRKQKGLANRYSKTLMWSASAMIPKTSPS